MAELQNTTINDTLDLKTITNSIPEYYKENSASTIDETYTLDIKLPESKTYSTLPSYKRQPGIYIDIPTKHYNLEGRVQIRTGYSSSGSVQGTGDMIFGLNGWYVKPTSGNSYISPTLGTFDYPFSYLYLKNMPYINGTSLISKSGRLKGTGGICLRFADGTQICYGYFEKSVAMTTAFGNIFYGTASNDITFLTKFTSNPVMLATLQDNDAISVSIMDKGGLTPSSYTGRWLFNSPISTTKSMVVSWAALGLWK